MLHDQVEESKGCDERTNDAVRRRQCKDEQQPEDDGVMPYLNSEFYQRKLDTTTECVTDLD